MLLKGLIPGISITMLSHSIQLALHEEVLLCQEVPSTAYTVSTMCHKRQLRDTTWLASGRASDYISQAQP